MIGWEKKSARARVRVRERGRERLGVRKSERMGGRHTLAHKCVHERGTDNWRATENAREREKENECVCVRVSE